MRTNKRSLVRLLAFVLVLAPIAITAVSGSARADDHRDRRHPVYHDRRGWDHGRGYYAPPPPPVYYAPPQPAPSPGISLFFPIR